jgi:glutamate--cysteine ligase
MTTVIKPHLETPIGSHDDLVAYLSRGCRPPEDWGIGTEMEKLVIDAATGDAATYERIEALLLRLEETNGMRPVREAGRLIALFGENSSITLEPGGQLELSGELCHDIHCCQGDFARHIAQVLEQATPLGLAFLGLGVQPFTPLGSIDWVPKARYAIMGPYMERTGDMGQAMMKLSAGLQVNLDFSDEADCIDKMRLSLLLSPLLYALFANSPFMGGNPTGFLSTRGEIWRRTDPDRTGLLPQLFAPNAGFSTYVDYALDVPMYFISRDGQFVDFTRERISFRRYLAEGYAGERATLGDWDLHLSTLFPEVRLRPQIEVRCADSLPPRLSLSVAALLKGLLYGKEARSALWEILGGVTPPELEEITRLSWRLGLRTPFGSGTLRDIAVEVLEIARRSLIDQHKTNCRGLDESLYLEEITEIAESGVTLAERLLSRWQGSRHERVAVLLDHCGYS